MVFVNEEGGEMVEIIHKKMTLGKSVPSVIV